MGEVIMGVDFRAPRGGANLEFARFHAEVRKELSDLVPFAKGGGPITDHNEYACSESNPEPAA